MTERNTGLAWDVLSFTLRFYDTGGLPFDGRTAREARDIRVGRADRCYVLGLKAGHTYVADIGFVEESGLFVALHRSAPVVMPGEKSGGADGLGGETANAVAEGGLAAHGGRFCGYAWYSAEDAEWLQKQLQPDAGSLQRRTEAGGGQGRNAAAAAAGLAEEQP
jgi:hypothetical protein